MKFLAPLFAFLTIALYSAACDAGQRATAPLVLPLPQSTAAPQTAHVPPVEVVVKPRLIPPGLKVGAGVHADVIDRWYELAYLFPEVASRIKRIEVRNVRAKWVVSYEAKAIYLNAHYGPNVQIDALTKQFARRAFDHLKRHNLPKVRIYKTWQRLADALGAGVK